MPINDSLVSKLMRSATSLAYFLATATIVGAAIAATPESPAPSSAQSLISAAPEPVLVDRWGVEHLWSTELTLSLIHI